MAGGNNFKKLDLRKLIADAKSGKITPQQALAEALKPRAAVGAKPSPTVNPRLTKTDDDYVPTGSIFDRVYESGGKDAPLPIPHQQVDPNDPELARLYALTGETPPPRAPVGRPIIEEDYLPEPRQNPFAAAAQAGGQSYVGGKVADAVKGQIGPKVSVADKFGLGPKPLSTPVNPTGFPETPVNPPTLTGFPETPVPAAAVAANPFLTAAGYGAGAITGGLQAKGAYNALKGDKLSFGEEAALALPTFGASFAIDPVRDLFKANRHPDDQRRRNQFKELREAGLLGENNTLELLSGEQRRLDFDNKAYNVNFDQPGVGDIVASVNPLAEIISGGNPKLRSDFAGYFTNAIANSDDPVAEARNIYTRAGLDPETASAEINRLFEAGAFDEATRDVYLGTLPRVFGTQAPAPAPKAKKKASGSSKKEEAPTTPQPTPAPLPPLATPLAPASPVAARSPEDFANAITEVYQANKRRPVGVNPNPYRYRGGGYADLT